MARRLILVMIAVFFMSSAVRASAEVVVLTEKPVAEFTLPDGSVLKNAFVWRRNSEGVMIVHDDGQFFLNFKRMPDEWQAAYLGIDPALEKEEEEPEPVATEDKFRVQDLFGRVPGLSDDGVRWLLREDAQELDHQRALTIALFHSLANKDRDKAKRYLLLIEEKGYKIDSVDLKKIFTPCIQCSGKGEYEQPCPACSGSGKCAVCEGTGLNKKSLGKANQPCDACDKTGECAECEGVKTSVQPCRKCRGRGQILNLQYCLVNRDHVVRQVNIEVGALQAGSLVQDEPSGLSTILEGLPGLDESAKAFYLSPDYEGGADNYILIAAVMRSLIREQGTDAARFNYMLEAYYPQNRLLNIDDYVKTCTDCKGLGYIETDCPSCRRGKAKGSCAECKGSGIGKTELRKGTECEACKGTGECPVCKGDGKAVFKCTACEGRGRILEKLRTEVKLEITVDELNSFYKAYLKEKEEGAEAAGSESLESLNA